MYVFLARAVRFAKPFVKYSCNSLPAGDCAVCMDCTKPVWRDSKLLEKDYFKISFMYVLHAISFVKKEANISFVFDSEIPG